LLDWPRADEEIMNDDHEPPIDREAALSAMPRLLVALAGACTLSGVVGFSMLVGGGGAPPLPLLLAPPVLVLIGGCWMIFRRGENARDR
jgi:hypothetical protein